MGKREERQEPTRQSGVRERIATNEALAAGLGSLSFSLSLSVERCPIYSYSPLYTLTHTRQRPTHTPELPSLRVPFFQSVFSSKLDREREKDVCVCVYSSRFLGFLAMLVPSSVCVGWTLWGWWLADWADCVGYRKKKGVERRPRCKSVFTFSYDKAAS